MSKPIIAVDIDDVLSESALGFIRYSNQQFGGQLTVDDYDEDWRAVWGVELTEAKRRADVFHSSGTVSNYASMREALSVLRNLKANYRLVVVTSRKNVIARHTRAWLDKHFPGVFDNLIFSGIYDAPVHEGMLKLTKTELLHAHRADYLIDDQPKHCLAAAESGINAILFGDYSWNRIGHLPAGVTRCNDWAAVKEYFDGQ